MTSCKRSKITTTYVIPVDEKKLFSLSASCHVWILLDLVSNRLLKRMGMVCILIGPMMLRVLLEERANGHWDRSSSGFVSSLVQSLGLACSSLCAQPRAVGSPYFLCVAGTAMGCLLSRPLLPQCGQWKFRGEEHLVMDTLFLSFREPGMSSDSGRRICKCLRVASVSYFG